MSSVSVHGRYQFYDRKPAQMDMAEEVLLGLRSEPKMISPKYFYDAKGSALFDQITSLDEYYLTRTEMALFDEHLDHIAQVVGDEVCLIEYGSGSSLKIRKLLQAVTPAAYMPLDISSEHLQANARALHQDFPEMDLFPVCVDFSAPFELPDSVASLTKVGFFPGSSIGNFEPADAEDFLRNVHATLGKGSSLLIGVDRKKPVAVLEAAYNDAAGVTADFNLNVLAHLNHELEGNFALNQFEHVASYNEQSGCIQMFLRSLSAQQVQLAGQRVDIAQGERLHTENSYKYHPVEFLRLAARAGFDEVEQWSDAKEWFTLYLLKAV